MKRQRPHLTGIVAQKGTLFDGLILDRDEVIEHVMCGARPGHYIDDDGVRRRQKRTLARGQAFRRVIASADFANGVEVSYHATKGYRRLRTAV